uniref:Bifunctional inhibitor/plant lipid transfer protein/seed storage helical domain-containing protein n=1 Tax=Oryza brachyantha TaxID=4533 RepID=J3LT59_ORYBR
MDPCRQYMMHYLDLDMGGYATMFMLQPVSLMQRQCCMQLQGMMPQCQCGSGCQMMQNMQQTICGGLMWPQMMNKMVMQLPNMCGMAPSYCQFSPYAPYAC